MANAAVDEMTNGKDALSTERTACSEIRDEPAMVVEAGGTPTVIETSLSLRSNSAQAAAASGPWQGPIAHENLAPIKMRQFIFTHTSGPVPRHAVLGVGGVQ